jgi:Uma2 family endonuclease
MAEALKKENRIYTYRDYASWPDDERWEIIEGEAYSMSPGAKASHQRYLRRLLNKFENYLEGKTCEVFDSPFDVVLPEEGETVDTATNTVQPDIMVICDSKKIFEDKCCLGAPDLVIEILSPSTASKDMKKKRLLYERFNVKEYWIVDPVHKTVQVFTLGEDKLYGKSNIYTSEDKIKVGLFADLEIDLKVIFA